MKGKWLVQKLNQNGFSLQDLSSQTGLSLAMLQSVAADELADPMVWDVIMDTLNQYPAVMTPASSVLEDLNQDIQKWGQDGKCIVYYGVNQNLLGFCEYKNLADGEIHGANVDTQFLASMELTLKEALELFTKQNYTLQKAE